MTTETSHGTSDSGQPVPQAGEQTGQQSVAGRAVQAAGPLPQRRTRRRRVRTAAAVVAALGAAGGGGWWLGSTAGAAGNPGGSAPTGPPTTALVTRQNLVDTQTVDGTLGYGDARQFASGLQGVVTWLPADGSTVSRGKALYRINDQPVVLLYGSLPLYRTLTVGDEGPDVAELEANLAALGYTGFTVDDGYTAETADAVRVWHADVGVAETGSVEPGRVVVAPGPVRVSDTIAELGARTAPGQPVLAGTGTARVVSVDLDVKDQQLARRGGKVTVTLPSEDRLVGTVASIGTVARAPQSTQSSGGAADSGSGSSSTQDATIEVTITLADPTRAGTLDQAPVDVEFVSDERKGVLTVPVVALLALREGGYGVEVVDGDGSRIVVVKVGMFASSRVEVSGTGLAPGMRVGVPPS
jgi:membrane fusion protein, multidrug efflux system